MSSAQLLHLRAAPPRVDPPEANAVISATTPDGGLYTTQLLDPAAPAVGAAQVLQNFKLQSAQGTTKRYTLGRWLTKALPGQTIGAGTWAVYAAQRVTTETASGATHTLWGFCIAQWRPGSGLIARFVDTPTTGSAQTVAVAAADRVVRNTAAGGALTLTAGDAIVVELWLSVAFTAGGNNPIDYGVLLGGRGQYVGGVYTAGALTDTDAYLLAPAAITFS